MHATTVPVVGEQAPDFTLRGPGGANMSLEEYRGSKKVVLVFFPLAFSPVCSHQLPEIQRHLREFEDLDAAVLGISVDHHHSNTAFAKQLGLSFPLLSDFHRKTCRDYGLFDEQRGYGGRALFVVDRKGRIVYRDVSANIDDVPSTPAVLEALRAAG